MNKKLFQEIWSPFELKTNRTVLFHIGPLDLWISREHSEWKIAWDYQKNESRLQFSKKPERDQRKLDWKRWIASSESDEICLKPLFPNRSIVVRPEIPVSLLHGESVMFFVGIPCYISVCVGPERISLCEIPTSILSNTWSGENTIEGELCYSLKTTAKRDHASLLNHFHRIISPIEVINNSKEIMLFQRLCLPVKYLSTYLGENRLWGNLERVVFRGQKKWERIVPCKEGPDFDNAEKLLSLPRQDSNRGILFNAFNVLVPGDSL
jgi:hypothetical protein